MSKRALVTGASGGIGAAISRALARDGFDVIVHANTRLEAAQAIAREIGSQHAVAFDVADAEATARALAALLDEGPIQVLVNNAGIHDDAAFPAMRPEQWQRVIDVSLNGFFNVTRALVMPMVRTRWGRIVSITSVAADLGNRGQANYAAAKAAVAAASRSLAHELGARGVTVNCVSPGIIATPMTEGAFGASAIERLVPLGRSGTPEEVAEVVAFLAGDAAGYITGQVVPVNGGMT